VSFWQRLFDALSGRSVARSPFPVRVELIPGELVARIHFIEDGELPGPGRCWAYVSEGLVRHGQQDIVFTLHCRPREAPAEFPRDPFQYFLDLFHQAERGKRVVAGDYHKFQHFLGLDGYVGMAYIPRESLPGVGLPERALTALLLTAPEVAVVEQLGSYRVLSLLGQLHWYYPCPPWSDRDRSSVLSPADLETSILSEFPALCIKGVTVRIDCGDARSSRHVGPSVGRQEPVDLGGRRRLVLNVRRDALPALRDQLARIPDQSPFALMTEPDPQARVRLVWKPGQDHMECFGTAGSDNSRITGGFVLFDPSAEGGEGGQICEDGFLVKLGRAAWVKLRGALLSGQAVSLPASSGLDPLTLLWTDQTYVNPIDGQRLTAEGGWLRYEPQGAQDEEETGSVIWKGSILLNPDEEYRQRLRDIDDLVRFGKDIDRTVQDFFTTGPLGSGEDLLLQCQVEPPGRASFQSSLRPGKLDEERVRGLYEALAGLEAFPVQHGPVRFQMVYTLWGGSGQPTMFDTRK
jgi:hypothetical protein